VAGEKERAINLFKERERPTQARFTVSLRLTSLLHLHQGRAGLTMPPRKVTKKATARYLDTEADEDESSSSSEEEQGETSQVTLQTERDEDDEDDEEEEDNTIEKPAIKRRRRTEAGTTKAEMKKWRRLAIEEKEAITNEGGLVWRAAQPLLASLETRPRKEASNSIRSVLDSVEERLDKVLMPRTTHMPHASRNLASGSALSSSGSIIGSIMSWQVERGSRILNDEEDEEDEQGEVSLLEMGGFSTDIALLETLLLPEATESVTMSRAVEEQERELETSKARLLELRADREKRQKEKDRRGSEVSFFQVRKVIVEAERDLDIATSPTRASKGNYPANGHTDAE
jgi:hypothetical protein